VLSGELLIFTAVTFALKPKRSKREKKEKER
jgi:hypothetical protein